jgi:hypothetical protein
MAAPLKPWERAGVNSRAFGGDIGNALPTPIVRCVIHVVLSSFVFVTFINICFIPLVGVEEVLLQLQDLASHHCLLEYPGQTQQTMIMVQFQAILHIEQAFQVIQALTVTVVDMGVIQDFLVAMVLVMEAMVTAMVDMEVTTLMEGEVMEGQVIIGKI